MELEKHIAPEGYVYVKDGQAGKVVITKKGSSTIEGYELKKIIEVK